MTNKEAAEKLRQYRAVHTWVNVQNYYHVIHAIEAAIVALEASDAPPPTEERER